jgi:hypothetical protein
MNFPSAPRTDTNASIVGGLLGGLAVAGAVLAFFSLRDPRDVRGADESLSELRISVAELRAETAELKAQLATRDADRLPPPFPPMPPPPPQHIEISMPPPPPPLPPGLEQAIRCPGENQCTIDRGYLEELLANPESLARQARIMPSIKDGEMRGFKMYGIRPGSLPKLLGYKNGDTVLSINGMPLTSMDGAMAMYSHLRRADSLSVEIERKGERMTKTCDLR